MCSERRDACVSQTWTARDRPARGTSEMEGIRFILILQRGRLPPNAQTPIVAFQSSMNYEEQIRFIRTPPSEMKFLGPKSRSPLRPRNLGLATRGQAGARRSGACQGPEPSAQECCEEREIEL